MRRVFAYFMTVIMMIGLLLGVPANTMKVEAATVTCGGLNVTGGTENTDFEYDSTNGRVVVKTSKALTFKSTSNENKTGIYINKDVDANITLDGVYMRFKLYNVAEKPGIEIADDSSGDVTISFVNKTRIHCKAAPAIQKNGTKGTLTIKATETAKGDFTNHYLFARTENYAMIDSEVVLGCAAIGGSTGKPSSGINFESGMVYAVSSSMGAAVGGGANGDGSNIKVSGGKLYALVGNCCLAGTMYTGAAIGGGYQGDGENITISGGEVLARFYENGEKNGDWITTSSGYYCDGGAGIGGGFEGDANTINITGGTVTAMGDTTVGSAGIGAGQLGNATGINITGGVVNATGGNRGAGIGNGWQNASSPIPTTDVTITGGTVVATGGKEAPGIGADSNAHVLVRIGGGSVHATGGSGADAIGFGRYQIQTSETNCYKNVIAKESEKNTSANVVSVEEQKLQFTDVNTDVSGRIEFKYTDGTKYTDYITNGMVTDANGYVYPYLPSGVTPSEKNEDGALNILYNGGAIKSCFNQDVSISANGYQVSRSSTSGFASSCTLTASGTYTLYFKGNITGKVTEKTVTVNIDKTAPFGCITLDGTDYCAANTVKDVQKHTLSDNTVSVYCFDNDLKTMEYGLSDTYYSENEIEGNVAWTEYNSIFQFPENDAKAIYVKLEDVNGNIRYLSTPLIYNDTTKPSNTVSVGSVSADSATVSISVKDSNDVDGIPVQYAYVLLPATETAPTNWASLVAKINAENGAQSSLTQDTTWSKTFTNLEANMPYKLYVISKNALKNLSSVVTENVSDITAIEFTTSRLESSVSSQNFYVKANIAATEYSYDLNDMLKADGMDSANIRNLQYTCTTNNGNVISSSGLLNVTNGIVTIPVKANIAENLTQDITVTFTSDNYEPMTTTLHVITVGKTEATLSGVTVSNDVYDGSDYTYSGEVQWMVNGIQCASLAETEITYVGIDGTDYATSTKAPKDAGSYQVNFKIADSNLNYKGTQSYTFQIKKASLTDEMSNVVWYLDDNNRIYSSEDAKVTEDGNVHKVTVKGYPSDKVTPVYGGTYETSQPGTYKATVSFALTNEASRNYTVPKSLEQTWQIVDRITPDMSNVQWVYKQGTTQSPYASDTKLYVNGQEYTVEVTGLPEGVKASYSGNYKASAAGNYTARVTFGVTDSTKYKTPSVTSMNLSWSIHKNVANVSGQTYSIKAGVDTTTYTYDANKLLTASGLSASKLENLTYTCAKGNGSILSGNPTISAQGIVTIPVYSNLTANQNQNITVTFASDNYELIQATLTVNTIAKTSVELTNVSAPNMVYNGGRYTYSGSVKWVADGKVCADLDDTDVTYVGVNGTDYASSSTAPHNAGTYQVTFAVKSNHAEYMGTQSYRFTIEKASLQNEMAGVAWYLDGNKVFPQDSLKVTENGNVHRVTVQGYPSDKVTPIYGGTYETSQPGSHTATVSFSLKDAYVQNYKVPDSMSLNWQIVDRITPDMSNVKWVYKQGSTQSPYVGATKLYVNGQEYTVEVTGLPEGVKASYSGTCKASAAGNYTAWVNFEVTDDTKYKTPSVTSMNLSWNIHKNVANVSGQTFSIKADMATTSYTYDVNKLLTASGLSASMFENLDYTYSKENGSILSGNPTISAQGIMTIPVYGNLTANQSQNIAVTFKSDNYEDVTATLTIKTIPNDIIQLRLTGVVVENRVYNGKAQGYSGDIVWKDENGTSYAYANHTDVTYVGVRDTVYQSSTTAPTDAGTYKVTFSVKNTTRYDGEESFTYTIEKADLSNEMKNIKWYIDGEEIDGSLPQVLYDGNVHTVSISNYPNDYVIPLYVNHQKKAIGQYVTVVSFEMNTLYEDNYKIPDPIELQWEIVEKIDEVVEKITPDMSKVKWIYKCEGAQGDYTPNVTRLYADGKMYTVEVTGVPEGVQVQYSGVCKASTAGTYQASATFKVVDSEKYNQPEPSSATLKWCVEEPEKEQVPLPAIGKVVPYDNGNYEVTSASEQGGTVAYTGPVNKKNATKVKIPATITVDGKIYQVTSIEKNAFSGCKKLSKVTIPNSVTTIGANAFKGCVKLTTISIPNSVEKIGANAFSGCKKLKTVTLKSGSKLKSIGDKAFYKCIALTKITITKNVTTIGKSAFYGCKKLKTITIKSKKLKKVGTKAIKGIHKKATIKCPGKKYVTKYKKLFKSKTGYKKSMKLKK